MLVGSVGSAGFIGKTENELPNHNVKSQEWHKSSTHQFYIFFGDLMVAIVTEPTGFLIKR